MSCALCQQDKKLCESHIYPEFLYEHFYDEDHTYKVLSTDEDQHVGERPKGIYEKLLCEDCESKLSGWETHGREVMFGGTEITLERQNGRIVIGNLEYNRFKLFQMSLLWRTAVASRKEVPDIQLGPHEEKMRRMLYNEEPGSPHQYGCVKFQVPGHTELLAHTVIPPEETKVGAHHCYRCVFGGLIWVYFVSSHTSNLPYQEVMLTRDGRLPIFNAGEEGEQYLQDLASDFRRNNREFFDSLEES